MTNTEANTTNTGPIPTPAASIEPTKAGAIIPPIRPKPAAQPLSDPVKLRVPESVMARHSDAKAMLYHLTDMMSLFPGSRDVLVYLPGQKPVRCSQSSRIDFTDELRARLVKLLGEENVKG